MSDRPIGLFIPSLHGGGAERNFARLARALAVRGHKVDLIVADADGPNRAWVGDVVRLVDLRVGRAIRAVGPLARYLKEEHPRVLLAALEHGNVVATLAHRRIRAALPLILTLRNTLSEQVARASRVRDRYVLPFLARRLYPHADRLVAVSQGAARDAAAWLRLPEARVLSIPNPVVDEALFRMAGEPIEHAVFEPGRDLVILAAGRLSAQKDFPTLIEAFARARRRGMRAQLAILGEGEDREMLRSQADATGEGAAITFAGFQPNPFAWMARAHVFALSSRYEGLPTVLIEAMACGARLVSTDCPSGPREILGDGRWGRLVPVADADALAAALAEEVALPRTSPSAEALAPYTETAVVQRYEQLIGELA